MGELQWALLIVCAVLVVALYFFSRRGKADEIDGVEADKSADTTQPDLFSRSEASYDEFGVGRPRARGTAAPAPAEPAVPRVANPGVPAPTPGASPLRPPSMGSLLGGAPASGARSAPSLLGTSVTAEPAPAAIWVRPEPVVQPAPAPAPVTQPILGATAATRPQAPSNTKLVALLVAPIEETDILGTQLHQALGAQGLRFGAGDLYHRMLGGRIVYSVASLIKPGKLIPAEAEHFSTKGLTVILNLPGPVPGEIAFDDMVATTRVLAAALKAEIFDTRRERLTDEIVELLRSEIRAWAAGSSGA